MIRYANAARSAIKGAFVRRLERLIMENLPKLLEGWELHVRVFFQPKLDKKEKGCCHMSHWQPGNGANGTLEQWREEFNKIPRSEHCRDCPLLSG